MANNTVWGSRNLEPESAAAPKWASGSRGMNDGPVPYPPVDVVLVGIRKLLEGAPGEVRADLLAKVRAMVGELTDASPGSPVLPPVPVEPAMDADPHWAPLQAQRREQQAQRVRDLAAAKARVKEEVEGRASLASRFPMMARLWQR